MKKEEYNKVEFFGEELLKIRKQKGLSQEELADKINVSRQSIHLWESGKIVPDIENILKLCNVLEITTDKLTVGLDAISLKKKKCNTKKIIHIILIIFIIIIIIYSIISIRKSIILMNLNNKLQNYCGLDNYNYVEKYYETYDLKLVSSYTHYFYYKNNVSKSTFQTTTINSILLNDYKEKISYNFDENAKTYEQYNLDVEIPENAFMEVGLSGKVSLGKNLQIVNFLYGFNPMLKIKTNGSEYILYWSTNIDELKINVVEKIDKETGLVKEKYEYENTGKTKITTYEIEINTTTDTDLQIPNIDEYKETYSFEQSNKKSHSNMV